MIADALTAVGWLCSVVAELAGGVVGYSSIQTAAETSQALLVMSEILT